MSNISVRCSRVTADDSHNLLRPEIRCHLCRCEKGRGGGGAAIQRPYKLTCTLIKNRGSVYCNLHLIMLYIMLLTFDTYFLFRPDFLNFPSIINTVTGSGWQMPSLSLPIGTHNHAAFDCKLLVAACRQTA